MSISNVTIQPPRGTPLALRAVKILNEKYSRRLLLGKTFTVIPFIIRKFTMWLA
jgi:hypothetical protein